MAQQYDSKQLKRLLVRGRTFGLRGRIWKAVVIKRRGDDVTWTYCNGEPPVTEKIDKFPEYLDGVYGIERSFLQECEKEYGVPQGS